jgi:hypothetical protein
MAQRSGGKSLARFAADWKWPGTFYMGAADSLLHSLVTTQFTNNLQQVCAHREPAGTA